MSYFSAQAQYIARARAVEAADIRDSDCMQLRGALKAQEIKSLEQINKYFHLTGELYGSYEAWSYFRPAPAVNNNSAYDLRVVHTRLGALVTTRQRNPNGHSKTV
ncbi:MAG TPA: hypothetical protein VF780_06970 [Nitrosospira sp.]